MMGWAARKNARLKEQPTEDAVILEPKKVKKPSLIYRIYAYYKKLYF